MAEIAPTALPHGTPVDADTAGEIRTMLDQLAACAMTGDTPRLYAYFSDHWLSSGFIGPQFIDQLVGATPTPVAVPNTIFVRDVTNIERLPDGRVGALVTIGGLCEQSQPQPTCVQYMGFVQQGGLWYVDYQITAIAGPHGGVTQLGQYLQEHGTPVATPAA